MDKRTAIAAGFAAAVLLAWAGSSSSATQLIFGQRLVIKNQVPDDETRNRLVCLAKGDSIAAPTQGTAGDPTCSGLGGGGGSITFSSDVSGQGMTAPLPCANWRPMRNGRGYRYLDRELDDGPCRMVHVRDGSLVKILCQGRGPSTLDFDLSLGQHQAPIEIALRLGSAPERYCMSFGGNVRRNGTDAKTFLAAHAAAPLVACSPSGAFVDGPAFY